MDKLVFTPTVADLRAAYTLHIMQAGRKRMGYFILFGAFIGILIAAIDEFQSAFQAIGSIAAMVIWAALVAGLLQLLLPRFWIPRLAKKIHKQQKDLRLESTAWWDDEKMHSQNAQGHAFLEFADMVKWRANDDILLLYRSDHMFNFLPTRIFDDTSLLDALIRRLEDAGIPGERK